MSGKWQAVICYYFMVTSLVVLPRPVAKLFHASLPLRSKLPSRAGIMSWTGLPYSFCVGDSPPFLNCSRVIPSFSSSKFQPV